MAVRDHFGLGASDASNDLTKKLLGTFRKEEVEASGLVTRYAGQWQDRFKNRLMIPITDEAGEVVAFSARQIDESEPGRGKYENSRTTAIYEKRKTLYHYAGAKQAGTGRTVVVEGYAGVWAAWEAGIEDVVATGGTELSDEQIGMLAAVGTDVVMSFDSGW